MGPPSGGLCASYALSTCKVGLAESSDGDLECNVFDDSRGKHDTYHELGLILEDIHDENVIVSSETLFFY